MDKLCSKCRKDIDELAVVCPYCSSPSEYRYLVTSNRNDFELIDKSNIEAIRIIVFIIASAVLFYVGFAIGGIWIGLFGIVVAYKVFTAICVDSPTKLYSATINCPGCNVDNKISWGVNSFDQHNSGVLECTGCKKQVMVVSSS